LKGIACDSGNALLACNGSRHGGWSRPRFKEGLIGKEKDLENVSLLSIITYLGGAPDAI
jgi:hypothetical protein